MKPAAQPQAPTPSPAPQTTPGPGERAERLADEVREDARRRADTYLRETVVPAGGE